jgi:hypothetical protein
VLGDAAPPNGHGDVPQMIKLSKSIVQLSKKGNMNKVLDITLKQSIPTRWNSNLRMLKSVYASHEKIHNYLTEQVGLTSSGSKEEREAELNAAMADELFNSEGLELFDALIQFLSIIDEFTNHMQNTSRPTIYLGSYISQSLPKIVNLFREDNVSGWSNCTLKSMLPFLNSFSSSFEKKFVTVIQDIHWFGYILHPLLKHYYSKMNIGLKKEFISYLKVAHESNDQPPPSSSTAKDKDEMDDLDISFGSIIIEDLQETTTENDKVLFFQF